MSSTDQCIFCAIVRGEAESSKTYEDDSTVAFLVLQPINPGHLVVIPKRHVEYLADLDAETGMHLFRVAQSMAAAIRSSDLRSEGVNLFLADGEAAGQEVFHVHLHVFPRSAGDSFRLDAEWRFRDRDELDRVAAQIRAAT